MTQILYSNLKKKRKESERNVKCISSTSNDVINNNNLKDDLYINFCHFHSDSSMNISHSAIDIQGVS